MNTPQLQTLLWLADIETVRLVVPELVALEVVAHQRRRITEALVGLRRHLATLQIRTVDMPTADTATTKFESEWRSKLRKAAWRPIPDGPPHRVLAERAVQRRKPFKDDGSGYRDALIFETVLQIAYEEPKTEVVFVSANTSDFGKGKFADDLLDQLELLVGRSAPTHLMASAAEAAEKYAPPAGAIAGKLRGKLKSAAVRSTVLRQLNDTTKAALGHIWPEVGISDEAWLGVGRAWEGDRGPIVEISTVGSIHQTRSAPVDQQPSLLQELYHRFVPYDGRISLLFELLLSPDAGSFPSVTESVLTRPGTDEEAVMVSDGAGHEIRVLTSGFAG